jgi:hypothetical protein
MSRRTRIVIWLVLSAAAVGAALLGRPISQDPSYHIFADHRKWLGIPNAADVVSNLAFCAVGALGLRRVFWLRRPRLVRDLAAVVLFAALCLTGIGSAYYHWAPDNARLVWDRLPMTFVFASVLSLVISDRIDQRLGFYLEFALIGLGATSVWYWYWTESLGRGDLRPYGLMQFYPPLGILLLFLLFPRSLRSAASWATVAGWYALAKLLEYKDAAVFEVRGWVSGHTLKHLAAAAAAYCIYRIWIKEAVREAEASLAPGRRRSS